MPMNELHVALCVCFAVMAKPLNFSGCFTQCDITRSIMVFRLLDRLLISRLHAQMYIEIVS